LEVSFRSIDVRKTDYGIRIEDVLILEFQGEHPILEKEFQGGWTVFRNEELHIADPALRRILFGY
jgi:hypothetical protein